MILCCPSCEPKYISWNTESQVRTQHQSNQEVIDIIAFGDTARTTVGAFVEQIELRNGTGILLVDVRTVITRLIASGPKCSKEKGRA